MLQVWPRGAPFWWRTYFFGLAVSVALQLAEEGVLLGQQHFDVLHAHSDYPRADVGLQSVDALVGRAGGDR